MVDIGRRGWPRIRGDALARHALKMEKKKISNSVQSILLTLDFSHAFKSYRLCVLLAISV